MRRVVLGLAVLLSISSTAHAMGPDVGFGLVAWNHDGTAALLERISSWDGDRERSYMFITTTTPVDDERPPTVVISSMQRDLQGIDEQLSVDDCKSAALELSAQIVALHFNSVVIRPDACGDVERAVVRGPAIVLSPPRTKLQRHAAELVFPGYRDAAVRDCANDGQILLEVAVGKAMVLVFKTDVCDSPSRTTVTEVLRRRGAYVLGASVN